MLSYQAAVRSMNYCFCCRQASATGPSLRGGGRTAPGCPARPTSRHWPAQTQSAAARRWALAAVLRATAPMQLSFAYCDAVTHLQPVSGGSSAQDADCCTLQALMTLLHEGGLLSSTLLINIMPTCSLQH